MPPKKAKKVGGETDLAPILPSGTIFPNKIIRDDVQITKYLTNGGFGRIYEGRLVSKGTKICIKVEKKDSSGLFMEQNYFIRFLKKEALDKWSKKDFIGLPSLVCFGVDMNSFDCKLRYLAMPFYEESLESFISRKENNILLPKEVKCVVLCIVNALEYLHAHKVSHGDIKKGNIMLLEKGKLEKVVLIDMGIAHWHTRFNDTINPKAKHNGTLLYTSLDAHEGREGVFRSDLQILAYNIIEWLTGELPWKKLESKPDKVYEMKKKIMSDIKTELSGLIDYSCASFIETLLMMSMSLKYEEVPNYVEIKKDLSLSFNTEPKSKTTKRITKKSVCIISENSSDDSNNEKQSSSKMVKKTIKKKGVMKNKDTSFKESIDDEPSPSKVIPSVAKKSTIKKLIVKGNANSFKENDDENHLHITVNEREFKTKKKIGKNLAVKRSNSSSKENIDDNGGPSPPKRSVRTRGKKVNYAE